MPLVRSLARTGYTIDEIAERLQVGRTTVYRWRDAHPEFRNALKEGKDFADGMVEDALYKSALGFTRTTMREERDAEGRVVKVVKTAEKVPPNATAALFWLKNRQPEKWRDRRREEERPQAGAAPQAVDMAMLIAPPFLSVHRAVRSGSVTDAWLAGGRGSGKSSFISLDIAYGLSRDEDANALVMQRISADIRDSTYAQMMWAFDQLGLSEEWEGAHSARRIRNVRTGQLVVFKGADDPRKTKGVKLERGCLSYLWLEEVDMFGGMADVRTIRQSATRGDGHQVRFYSFNPPASRESWANVEFERVAALGDPSVIAHRSTYLDVPAEWLGEQFIADAEGLKEADDTAYRHEYLGEAVGVGGDVFTRAELSPIADEQIRAFDRLHAGQDWGWWPDPWAFTLSAWEPGTRTLYTFAEAGGNRLQPGESARMVRDLLTWPEVGVEGREEDVYHAIPVLSDDADPGSIAAHRDEGVNAVAAGKGGNRMLSYQWLAGVRWVIDPVRCPHLAKEVRAMQYERTKSGEWLNAIPDGDDHWIDATRYAMMPVVTRRGAYGTDKRR